MTAVMYLTGKLLPWALHSSAPFVLFLVLNLILINYLYVACMDNL